MALLRAGHAWRWEQLDTTAAWNSRAGPQLQWLGASSRYLIFNDLGCGGGGGAGSSGSGGSSAAAAAAVGGATSAAAASWQVRAVASKPFLLGSPSGALWLRHRGVLTVMSPKENPINTRVFLAAAESRDAGTGMRLHHLVSVPTLFWCLHAARRPSETLPLGLKQCLGVPHPLFFPQGDACAVVYDLQRMTRSRALPLPLHSVSADGSRGLTLNFRRLEAAAPGADF